MMNEKKKKITEVTQSVKVKLWHLKFHKNINANSSFNTVLVIVLVC